MPKIAQNNIVFSTAVLEDVTSTGKKKFWVGHVEQRGKEFGYYTEFWQEGAKKQQSAFVAVKGKNLGRANETIPRDQAIAEIESQRDKKTHKGYVPQGAKRTRVLSLPMLAHNYEKRGHDIVFPCDGQPKYDGVRVVTDGTQFWSREGNLFHAANTAHLRFDAANGTIFFDGEMMLEGVFNEDYDFNDIISALKEEDSPEAHRLRYHVFDIVAEELTWQERKLLLRDWFDYSVLPDTWRLVPTTAINAEADVETYLEQCLKDGYEGIMLRNLRGKYKLKNRSKDLQKYKKTKTEEFRIVRVVEGRGKDKGTPICVCVTKAKKEFNARMMGSLAWRQQVWRERDAIINEDLTVAFQDFTPDGVPRFPRGVAIRNYEGPKAAKRKK